MRKEKDSYYACFSVDGKDIEAEIEKARCRTLKNTAGSNLVGDLFSFEIRNYILPYLEIERTLVMIRRL